VILVTDGVTETEGADGTFFGEQRVLDLVRANRHEPSTKIVNRIYRAVRDFAGRSPQVDDITVVVCRLEHVAAA